MLRSAHSNNVSLSSLSLFTWQRRRKMNMLHVAEEALKWKFFGNVTKSMKLYMLAGKNFGNMYSKLCSFCLSAKVLLLQIYFRKII